MLKKEEFDFITNNKAEDPKSLAFKTHGMFPNTMGFLLNQIKLRQKTKKKLPTWFENTKLLFPTNLSSEQCSSEITSDYKASLFKGKSFIDLTGGLGVDTLAFSRNFDSGIYIERNEELAKIAKHNLRVLEANHISVISDSGIDYLIKSDKVFDLVYIDPDRRPTETRVYDFSDCQPNVLEHLDLLLDKGKKVLIKASPMLNIDLCINQLRYVENVTVVSYKNDCKEILFTISKGFTGFTDITAVELGTDHKVSVNFSELDLETPLTDCKTFIYDPYVSFRKAGMTEYLAEKHQLTTFNPNSFILTSDKLLTDFPGRIFKLIKSIPADKKALKKEGIKRANLITRGFFLSADLMHKQLKLDRGGNTFLIPQKNTDGKVVLHICEKI